MSDDRERKVQDTIETMARAGEAARDVLFERSTETIWVLIALTEGEEPTVATNVDGDKVPDFLRFTAHNIEASRIAGASATFKKEGNILN